MTTDADGQFAVAGFAVGLVQFTLSAPGYLTYRSKLNLTDSRTGIIFDLIPSATPFDLEFYRQFARGKLDGPMDITRRWTVAPSFYLQTVTADTGEELPPVILDSIERVVVNAVPELSAGLLTAATVERGREQRSAVFGWVVVQFYRNPIDGTEKRGDATVGGNASTVRIRYDPVRDASFGNIFGCGAESVHVVDHEIVHVMGFRHTAQVVEDFQSGTGCPGAGRPERVRFHAAVMYSRPPGNSDLDNDSGSYIRPLGLSPASKLAISCGPALFVR